MLNIAPLILKALTGLAKALGLFFIYNKGKDAVKLAQLKRNLKENEKNEKNKLRNARKSNVRILDELKERDGRK